ncbi:HDOD domain-containing protein [Massilia sp. S19_KUP03_FR1]|uniref:HDOD domain-containing protein n=1 Tax=Massilia sp. S19_KUP03_FR1 TaxID=3025503 RepID=UPI002FCD6CEF
MNRLEAFGYIAAQATRGEISLPTSVNAVLRLQLALDKSDCHLEDAIRLTLGEPQLAARTVALANSAAFNGGGGAAITNVRAAVNRIGYRNLQTLVASLLVRQFGARITDPTLRAKAEQLWQHTAHVAALAQVFARRMTGVNPDTAVFAAIVHEVGGFYLLSRADEFPGLLDADPENWATLCEEVVSREVIRKLAVPEEVATAIAGLRAGMLSMSPTSLLDTLLLANQYAPVPSPLDNRSVNTPRDAESTTDLMFDEGVLATIQVEAEDAYRTMSAALLV